MTQRTKTILKSTFETNDYPTQQHFADLIDSSPTVAPLFENVNREITVAYSARTNPTWQFTSGTFTGYSTPIGTQPGFSSLRIKVRAVGADPSSLVFRIREGSQTGATLATKTVVGFSPDADDFVRVDFDASVNSDAPLYLEVLADSAIQFYGTATASGVTLAKYLANGAQTGNFTLAIGSAPQAEFVQYAEFFETDDWSQVSQDGKNILREGLEVDEQVRIVLPDEMQADAFGATNVQYFLRGMIDALDPYQLDVRFTLPGVHTGGASARRYNRYLEFYPAGTINRVLTVDAYSKTGALLDSKSCTVRRTQINAAPAAPKRVLFIGDSLTAASVYTGEFNRRLTGSGGSPAGHSFSNISLVGTEGSGANLHEGINGATFTTFASPASSPFANAGGTALDVGYYVTNNSLPGLEQVYIMLGVNHLSNTLRRPTAADWAGEMANLQLVIDAILTAYPSCQITLAGPPLVGPRGALGGFGDYSSGLGNYRKTVQALFSLHLALQDKANEPANSSNVDFLSIAMQFDSENGYNTTTKAVNQRSATTEIIESDAVHPSTSGYYQIADAFYRHFGALYC